MKGEKKMVPEGIPLWYCLEHVEVLNSGTIPVYTIVKAIPTHSLADITSLWEQHFAATIANGSGYYVRIYIRAVEKGPIHDAVE